MLGRKYKLNYVFRNSSSSLDTSLSASIKAYMEAKILYLSGTAGVSLESSKLSDVTTASTIIRSYGGAGSNSTSIETARESYSTYLQVLIIQTKLLWLIVQMLLQYGMLLQKYKFQIGQQGIFDSRIVPLPSIERVKDYFI